MNSKIAALVNAILFAITCGLAYQSPTPMTIGCAVFVGSMFIVCLAI